MFITQNSAPYTPTDVFATIRLIALLPPPPTPITLIRQGFNIGSCSVIIFNDNEHDFVENKRKESIDQQYHRKVAIR